MEYSPTNWEIADIPIRYPLEKQEPINTCPERSCLPIGPAESNNHNGRTGLSLTVDGEDWQQQLQLLPMELALYSKDLSQRPVDQVWLKGGELHRLSPADLTLLCYQISSALKHQSSNIVYGFEIDHRQITADRLALLQGLHFNRLRIHFGNTPELCNGGWMRRVDTTLSLLDNAGFDQVECQVKLTEFTDIEALNRLLLSLQLYNPQQIELIGSVREKSGKISPQTTKAYLNILKRAQQRGYQVLGNQILIPAGSKLKQLYDKHQLHFTPWGYCATDLTAWFGLGLSATGHTGAFYYRNCSNLRCYRDKLSSGYLPYQWRHLIGEQQTVDQALVQSLLCYGQVNNDLLEALPANSKQQADRAIARACERLWLESNTNQWQLTATGRTNLQALLHDLQLAP
ncbi:hypothetical protein KFE80_01045 [bacterium SCSIO 12696]|nr:hypothetical protein KFE80_01045 [bacterium SCSIO 12696]